MSSVGQSHQRLSAVVIRVMSPNTRCITAVSVSCPTILRTPLATCQLSSATQLNKPSHHKPSPVPVTPCHPITTPSLQGPWHPITTPPTRHHHHTQHSSPWPPQAHPTGSRDHVCLTGPGRALPFFFPHRLTDTHSSALVHHSAQHLCITHVLHLCCTPVALLLQALRDAGSAAVCMQ